MDTKLTSLERCFISSTEQERKASVVSFVEESLPEIRWAIDKHQEFWLDKDEPLEQDVENRALLECVSRFQQVRDLEQRITGDTRALGITQATWLPYAAAIVHPMVQQCSKAYSAGVIPSANSCSQTSEEAIDFEAVREFVEELRQLFDPRATVSVTADTGDPRILTSIVLVIRNLARPLKNYLLCTHFRVKNITVSIIILFL